MADGHCAVTGRRGQCEISGSQPSASPQDEIAGQNILTGATRVGSGLERAVKRDLSFADGDILLQNHRVHARRQRRSRENADGMAFGDSACHHTRRGTVCNQEQAMGLRTFRTGKAIAIDRGVGLRRIAAPGVEIFRQHAACGGPERDGFYTDTQRHDAPQVSQRIADGDPVDTCR